LHLKGTVSFILDHFSFSFVPKEMESLGVRVTTMTSTVQFELNDKQRNCFKLKYKDIQNDARNKAYANEDFGLSITGALTRPKTMQMIDTERRIRDYPVYIAYRPTVYKKKSHATVGNFYNQITFKYTPDTKRCIKVFQNGSMHLSGFTSEQEMRGDSVQLFSALFGFQPTISNVRVCMANAMWHLRTRIDFQECVEQSGRSNTGLRTDFQPELSSSRIKLMHPVIGYNMVVTVNGSVMYTHNSLSHLEEGYHALKQFLCEINHRQGNPGSL
jgi:hypothetical protein